ncbi:unnamed protein product [Arctia plantaginis]|uniref:Uncharacterized protein n=1 Tax=Arctia plantaginis TaxID=874455 RepID=A0A8S1AI63_ARCPL|nr:unnamed protein product [Arctia plantaginis]CAB3260701.1 unnamed protein product [Arctia plantaginis]
MELMSSLLLFALVVYFPQALGDSLPDSGAKLKLNDTKVSHQRLQNKKLHHNLHDSPAINASSELQSLFMDPRCKKCIDCMGRAVHKYKAHAELKKKTVNTELREELLSNKFEFKNRIKREDDITTTITSALPKKTKSKKKSTKSVTVTKYNIDGEVYGLKVKETKAHTVDQSDNESSMCRIYSVKKSYDCDTPESESFLASKRKVNKKNKKEKEKSTTLSTTPQAYFSSPSYRKRHIDPSEMPENIELSMEDVY